MTEPVSASTVINPYPQTYPGLHEGFVSLQQQLTYPWYTDLLLLHPDRSEAAQSILTFVTLLSAAFAILASSNAAMRGALGLYCLLPIFLVAVFQLARWYFEAGMQRRVRRAIESYADSIPESTLTDVIVCLRDFAKNDPVILAAIARYREVKLEDNNDPVLFDGGAGELALNAIKHPSPINTFRAVEYLMADYPVAKNIDVGDDWGLDFFATKRNHDTYAGVLTSLQKDQRIAEENAKREAATLAATEALASLKPHAKSRTCH